MYGSLFICHGSPSWLFTKGRSFYFSLLASEASHAVPWAPEVQLVPTGITPFFPNTIWRTGLENQPWHLWVVLHSVCCRNPRQLSPLYPSFLLFFCLFFPRQNGCGFRFYRKCSAYPFFGEQWEPTHQAPVLGVSGWQFISTGLCYQCVRPEQGNKHC